jgi:hypothetical protein
MSIHHINERSPLSDNAFIFFVIVMSISGLIASFNPEIAEAVIYCGFAGYVIAMLIWMSGVTILNRRNKSPKPAPGDKGYDENDLQSFLAHHYPQKGFDTPELRLHHARVNDAHKVVATEAIRVRQTDSSACVIDCERAGCLESGTCYRYGGRWRSVRNS